MNGLKQQIRDFICTMAKELDAEEAGGIWRPALVGFADAENAEFTKLREIVHPLHAVPTESLPGARTVVSYFLPFTPELGKTNAGGTLSSEEWAAAYVRTNRCIRIINDAAVAFLQERGFAAMVPPEAYTFDEERIKSCWSQRHIARICGLGTFGLNNMLISEVGSCGRYASFLTSAVIEPDPIITEDRCLFRREGLCGVCADKCITGALSRESFDRVTCFEACHVNGRQYGYMGETEVCGKCVVDNPCSFCCP